MELQIELYNGNRKARVILTYSERKSLIGASKVDVSQNGTALKPTKIDINKFIAPRTSVRRNRKVNETTKTVHTWRLNVQTAETIRMNLDMSLADRVENLPNFEGDVLTFSNNFRLYVTLVGINRILEVQFLDKSGNPYFTFGLRIGDYQINAVLHSTEFLEAVKKGRIEETKDEQGRILVKQVILQN
jgi:hypothetical protein